MKISKEDLREEVIKLNNTVKHIKTLISDEDIKKYYSNHNTNNY